MSHADPLFVTVLCDNTNEPSFIRLGVRITEGEMIYKCLLTNPLYLCP